MTHRRDIPAVATAGRSSSASSQWQACSWRWPISPPATGGPTRWPSRSSEVASPSDGRLLHRRLRLPTVHPLIAALAGALVVFDLAVIPYAGVFALAAVAMAGLGLAVVTRFGSTSGWSFVDLDW